MSNVFDLVILGGGCAGLSLAYRLAELGVSCPKTLILERRAEYTNDRTWCFFRQPDSLLTSLVSHSWPEVSLSSAAQQLSVDCTATPYQAISAQSFYSFALDRIAACPQMRLLQNCSAGLSAEKRGGLWHAEANGQCYQARFVVDTRPASAQQQTALLWQSFSGAEIECNEAVFRPGAAQLMHFSPDAVSGILFTYVLPYSERRALIETTAFSPKPIPRGSFAATLAQAVQKHTSGARYETIRVESGILPMGAPSASPSADRSYVQVGLHSGAARASTGYAFQRIQRWAAACSKSISAGQPPLPHRPDPAPVRAMDHLFLSVLRARPDLAPEIFLSLFGKADPGHLIRFLSDRATAASYASIIAALPFAPFLDELPRALLRQFRPVGDIATVTS